MLQNVDDCWSFCHPKEGDSHNTTTSATPSGLRQAAEVCLGATDRQRYPSCLFLQFLKGPFYRIQCEMTGSKQHRTQSSPRPTICVLYWILIEHKSRCVPPRSLCILFWTCYYMHRLWIQDQDHRISFCGELNFPGNYRNWTVGQLFYFQIFQSMDAACQNLAEAVAPDPFCPEPRPRNRSPRLDNASLGILTNHGSENKIYQNISKSIGINWNHSIGKYLQQHS